MDDSQLKPEAITLKDHVQYGDGAVVSRTLLKQPTGTLTLFAFDKGQELSEHTAPFNAAAVIVDGEGQITIGGQPFTARTGDIVMMPANIPHAVKAVEKFKMLLIMIRS
jgi:quercetin dioxygenase-like cupin family protein